MKPDHMTAPSWHPLAYRLGSYKRNRAAQLVQNILRKTVWHKAFVVYGYYQGSYTYCTTCYASSLAEAFREQFASSGWRDDQAVSLKQFSRRTRISGLIRPGAYAQRSAMPLHVQRRIDSLPKKRSCQEPVLSKNGQLLLFAV